ncbi:hypothetical protein KSP39_PZI015244 [Platanthera zijinensis]|uniref:Uncharacterized protein n=1 Tax=Platanthera zijinensis TaxID=2320716 RepID=A0AAP0B7U6_9ASPA
MKTNRSTFVERRSTFVERRRTPFDVRRTPFDVRRSSNGVERRSPFVERRSTFVEPRSTFVEPRSTFAERRSSNPVRRSSNPVRRSSNPVRRSSNPVRRSSNPVRRSSNPVALDQPEPEARLICSVGSWVIHLSLNRLRIDHSSFSSDEITRSAQLEGDKTEVSSNRKLNAFPDSISAICAAKAKGVSNGYDLDDYPGHDTSPSSKVDVHSGPIENGGPFVSYAHSPAPSPRNHSRHVSP